MNVFDDLAAWRTIRRQFTTNQTLGFVPTMGNLHAGHLALIQQSQQDNVETVVSLFINPTQFNQPEDFQRYPRTRDADLALLTQAGVTYCLIPSTDAMYPDAYHYQLHETKASQLQEGQHRPGHFTGMLTVVMKLLQLTQPTRAYFGEKDYQQLQLIRGMVAAFHLDIEIIGCPIVREANGLAFSSRNSRLSPAAKEQAIEFARLFKSTPSCAETIEKLIQLGITVDYVEEYGDRRFAAVTIDGVRLIDNRLIAA